MSNWTLPSLTSTYANVLTEINGKAIDSARMFSTAYTAATNMPAGTIRWNDTNKNWERYSGTAWAALTAQYTIDVTTLGGIAAGSFLRSDATDTATGALTFSGNANFTGTWQRTGVTITATAAELNKLDGVTATTAELNILDGVTATAAELNAVDGSTAASAITADGADRVVYNDAGVMKQVSLDTVRTYLTGGLAFKVVSIGAWNMTTTANVFIPHGASHANIRSVTASIKWDTFNNYDVFEAKHGSTIAWDSSVITLSIGDFTQWAGSEHDGTGASRGYVTIIYIP